MSFWSELHNFTCLSLSSTGWWFGTWILFSIISGMSSFPLTFIFFKMVKTTNQTITGMGPNKKTKLDEQLLKHSIILLYMLWTFLLMLIGGPGVLLHTHILEAVNRTLQQKLLNYSKSSEIRYSNSKKLKMIDIYWHVFPGWHGSLLPSIFKHVPPVCNHFCTTHFLTHVNISHNPSFSPLCQGFSWFFFPPGCSTTRWGMGQALQGPRCSQRPLFS